MWRIFACVATLITCCILLESCILCGFNWFVCQSRFLSKDYLSSLHRTAALVSPDDCGRLVCVQKAICWSRSALAGTMVGAVMAGMRKEAALVASLALDRAQASTAFAATDVTLITARSAMSAERGQSTAATGIHWFHWALQKALAGCVTR